MPPEREKSERVHGGIKTREISVDSEWRPLISSFSDLND
jgi:hypothetical protein